MRCTRAYLKYGSGADHHKEGDDASERRKVAHENGVTVRVGEGGLQL
jgi:hypothetical protein